jgi:hypothetical protein
MMDDRAQAIRAGKLIGWEADIRWQRTDERVQKTVARNWNSK